MTTQAERRRKARRIIPWLTKPSCTKGQHEKCSGVWRTVDGFTGKETKHAYLLGCGCQCHETVAKQGQ